VDRTLANLDRATAALASRVEEIRVHGWPELPPLPDDLTGLARLGAELHASLQSRARFRVEYEQQQRFLGLDPTPVLEMLDVQAQLELQRYEQAEASYRELRDQIVGELVVERFKHPGMDLEAAVVEIRKYRDVELDALHEQLVAASRRPVADTLSSTRSDIPERIEHLLSEDSRDNWPRGQIALARRLNVNKDYLNRLMHEQPVAFSGSYTREWMQRWGPGRRRAQKTMTSAPEST